jgi:hypothetical protein
MLAFKALESVRARGEVEQERLKACGRREGGERGQHLNEDQIRHDGGRHVPGSHGRR